LALGLAAGAGSAALLAAGLVHLAAARPNPGGRMGAVTGIAGLAAAGGIVAFALDGLLAGRVPDPVPVAGFALLSIAGAGLGPDGIPLEERLVLAVALLGSAALGFLTGSDAPDFLLAINLAALVALGCLPSTEAPEPRGPDLTGRPLRNAPRFLAATPRETVQ
jgi:peptidoglycan/LPS O-acetylase OafA/YrhL